MTAREIMSAQRETEKSIAAWWRKVTHPDHKDRAALARLRRARDPLDAIAVVAAEKRLPSRQGRDAYDRDIEAVCIAFAVLGHVRSDAGPARSFAEWLGAHVEGSENPRLSEPRFRRLANAQFGADLIRELRRVVKLLDSSVPVNALVRLVLDWNAPWRLREMTFAYYRAPPPSRPEPDAMPAQTQRDDQR